MGSTVQQRAVRKTIRVLGPVPDALVSLAVGLAKAVDADSSSAALWREYRAAVLALLEAGEVGDDDDAEILELVQTPLRPKVGDSS